MTKLKLESRYEFSGWPSYSEEEANAVKEVLLSNKVNYWTGNEARTFEREFASFAGAQYAIAVANGTVALELAIRALGIGIGDEVIVTSRTFVASVSSIVNSGAKPVFVDVGLDSQNIEVESILPAVNGKTKAIVCVHLAGWPCDMGAIMALANARGLYVIEDCAQAHGAKYKGKSVGTFGHVSAWSFCQDKIMTTGGEGGMITTNSEVFWRLMWEYKDHGKSFDAVYNRTHPSGFRWLHDSFGTNFRMTEMQAVLGRLQLRKLPKWTEKRIQNAELLSSLLVSQFGKNTILRFPKNRCESCESPEEASCAMGCVHAYYRYYVFLNLEYLKENWTRDRIVSSASDLGIPCMQGSCSEVYLEAAFERHNLGPAYRLQNARELGDTAIAFLVHPTLTSDEIELIAKVFSDVVRDAMQL